MKKIFIILVFLCFLSACESKKTTSYYADHPEEMKAKLKQCHEDASLLVKDPDCINANKAWSVNFFKPVKLKKDMPTPDLDPLEEGKAQK
jgi:hypothetical protein